MSEFEKMIAIAFGWLVIFFALSALADSTTDINKRGAAIIFLVAAFGGWCGLLVVAGWYRK